MKNINPNGREEKLLFHLAIAAAIQAYSRCPRADDRKLRPAAQTGSRRNPAAGNGKEPDYSACSGSGAARRSCDAGFSRTSGIDVVPLISAKANPIVSLAQKLERVFLQELSRRRDQAPCARLPMKGSTARNAQKASRASASRGPQKGSPR